MTRDAHYPQSCPAAPADPGRGIALALAFLLVCGLSACTGPAVREHGPLSSATVPAVQSEQGRRTANEVLIRAIGLVGTPYRYGGDTPEGGFDCSGLVAYVFREAAGLRLPRSTREQIAWPAAQIAREHLGPGDLVFFAPGGGAVSHIGIYVGEGRFVHAPSSGGTVRLDKLDTPYWRQAYVSARRLLR